MSEQPNTSTNAASPAATAATTAATTSAAQTVAAAVTSTPAQMTQVTVVSAPQVAVPISQVVVSQHGQLTSISMPHGSMTPALTQMVASMAQPITTPVQTVGSHPTAGAVIRSSLPAGTVQVIQAHPFVQQQYMQQQYYIQGIQAMQQPVGQQMVQTVQRPGNAGQKSPIISAAQLGSQTVTLKSMSPSMTTVAATQTKGGPKTVLQQQQAIFGNKVLRGANGQPLVIGVLQNSGGTQTLVAQSKSPSVSIAQGTGQQVYNSPTQIRFTTQPTFVTSQGQIISGTVTPAMLNQLQLLGSQPHVIGTQPLYLRPAGPIPAQGFVSSVQAIQNTKTIRQGTDASGGVQMKSTGTQVKTVAPTQVRGVANILPQTARPFAQLPGSPTMAKGVQTGQIKQVSRVRALRPTKTIAAVSASGQPARIAPQQGQIGTARLFTPGTMTRPPTVLVQPKPQVTQQRTIATPVSQIVTLATMTSIPITMTSQIQTQAQSGPIRQTMALSPATTSPVKTSSPIILPIKPEMKLVVEALSESEPMETEPPVLCEAESATTPITTATAIPTGPPTLTSASPVKVSGGGMVGAGAGPPKIVNNNTDSDPPALGPPIQTLPPQSSMISERKVATVIGERQAAIVRPNILTHVIEGFVIQEGTEPFPVQRCSTLSDFIPDHAPSQEVDSGVENHTDESSMSSTDSKQRVHKELPKLKCEYCGTMASARRFGNSQRFCSRACAKRYNVGCSRRVGLFNNRKRVKLPASIAAARKHKNLQMKRVWKRGQTGRVTTGPIQRNPDSSALTVDNIRVHTSTTHPDRNSGDGDLDIGVSGLGAPSTMSMETTTSTSDESERSTSPSGQDESSSPRSPPELERVEMDTGLCNSDLLPVRHPAKWTVREVVDFIRNLQGCSVYADEFNRQEIDGQALMLLKEDHLMSTMNVKLGPALKICAKIKSLIEELP